MFVCYLFVFFYILSEYCVVEFVVSVVSDEYCFFFVLGLNDGSYWLEEFFMISWGIFFYVCEDGGWVEEVFVFGFFVVDELFGIVFDVFFDLCVKLVVEVLFC